MRRLKAFSGTITSFKLFVEEEDLFSVLVLLHFRKICSFCTSLWMLASVMRN